MLQLDRNNFPAFFDCRQRCRNINNCHPCVFLKNELCEIHENRPIDCRLYPFDILKINDDFFWIFWKNPCPILKKTREELELFLIEHEKKLLNQYKDYIAEYSKFKFEELIKRNEFVILRKIIFEG